MSINRLTRSQLAARICEGDSLFIYRSRVINATSWQQHHPGGSLAILHFVGRDATDEVEAYHSTSALTRLSKYAIGSIDVDSTTGWTPLTPPIALGLVRHPDGIKGNWKREGPVRLAGSSPAGTDIVTLSAADIEPRSLSVDPVMERKRSIAYQDLKMSRMAPSQQHGTGGPPPPCK